MDAAVETERMVLRPWTADDLGPLSAICAVPAVWHYPFGRALTAEESEQFLTRHMEHWSTLGLCMWAAERKADRTLLGFIGLAPARWLPAVASDIEVGWRLHPDHWGQGLATEGARACLRYGFEERLLDRIVSIFDVANVASGRVMEKVGMRDLLTTSDPRWDHLLHVRAITRREWQEAQAGQALP